MANRRAFLATGATSIAALLCESWVRRADAQPKWSAEPFSLGVASGSPRPDGFVLWTRLAPDTLLGGVPNEPIDVAWELAADDAFRTLVRKGTERAVPESAHSVHVEVSGLEAGRDYWYRFRSGDAVSRAGRARTAPAAGAMATSLRFAFASCQHYEHGYFSAYRHLAAENVDLVVFLGDYIYEYGGRPGRTRMHSGGECVSLEDYRRRYAQYKRDPDLQIVHAAAPWIATWDDHEVQNDYADDRGETLAPDFLARRAAAYQAYYEHMPLRREVLTGGLGSPRLRIHDRYDFGTLARFHLLDDRQYRSHQVCPKPGRGGSNTVDAEDCPERTAAERTMLGAEQESWLFDGLRRSTAKWNVIAQQTLMAQIDHRIGPGKRFWTDGWDGYPAARARLLGFLARQRPANPVVISGDVHSTWVTDLKPDFDDPASPVVATEICGTSLTAPASVPQERAQAVAAENPHVRFANTERRGYVLVDLAPERLTAKIRVVDDVALREPSVSTLASFEVESGNPGARRVG